MQELFLLCAFIFKVLRSFSACRDAVVAVMLFLVVLAFRFSFYLGGGLGSLSGLSGWWILAGAGMLPYPKNLWDSRGIYYCMRF